LPPLPKIDLEILNEFGTARNEEGQQKVDENQIE
jgi:hypothetical protein